MKDEKSLVWTLEDRKHVFSTRVFKIAELKSQSPKGENGTFTVMDAPDWAIIIPVLQKNDEDYFVMVRQWRHGSQELSLEFPGGVFEPGEDGKNAAAREMQEETGFTANNIEYAGAMSPNPAIMSNHVHFFIARDLVDTGKQNLDSDEFVDIELVPAKEVIEKMGRAPYVHALMASALCFYLRESSRS
ncbi:MAG: NUDIX hydrolase [Treponema sp.]|jgi:8-oxo-dGTP pyrophosphatase MutT (NUDIX family)|nr:NUDIX hydrolase [Treponema sp.]